MDRIGVAWLLRSPLEIQGLEGNRLALVQQAQQVLHGRECGQVANSIGSLRPGVLNPLHLRIIEYRVDLSHDGVTQSVRDQLLNSHVAIIVEADRHSLLVGR